MISAYDTPGWTAQNMAYLADGSSTLTTTPTNSPVLPLPNVIPTNVTANYVDGTGVGSNGMVIFTPTVANVSSGGVRISLQEIKAPVVAGKMSVYLLPTDDPDVTPPFLWVVREILPEPGKTYKISIPYLAVSPVNLFTLPVVDGPVY